MGLGGRSCRRRGCSPLSVEVWYGVASDRASGRGAAGAAGGSVGGGVAVGVAVEGGTMTAIETHYVAPTNYRGARIVARALGTGQRIILGWEDGLNADANHAAACRALAERWGWLRKGAEWIDGDGGKGARVWVLVLRGAGL